MPEYRVTFRLKSSLGTPLQADTIFGHICWAIRYLEGERALTDFLAAYESEPPLLVSDGLPLVGEARYLPMPAWPVSPADANALAAALGISTDDLSLTRPFLSAFRALAKKPYVEESALIARCDPLDLVSLARACFELSVCPQSMAPLDRELCRCEAWIDCPALETGRASQTTCAAPHPSAAAVPVMHNVINRWTTASEGLFAQEDTFHANALYFLVRADPDVVPLHRLESVLDYIRHSGYGRDKSTGKGAMTDLRIDPHEQSPIEGANGFVNLSSAYVPVAGELGKAFYNTHVKRGKLGGSYVLEHSPWKRPVLMLRAGSVFLADPERPHGCLVKGVHYELPEVVQYGYAYPLAVRLDENAFGDI